jgi:hypothetical protein
MLARTLEHSPTHVGNSTWPPTGLAPSVFIALLPAAAIFTTRRSLVLDELSMVEQGLLNAANEADMSDKS